MDTFYPAAEIKKMIKACYKKTKPQASSAKSSSRRNSSDTFHIEEMITHKYSIASKDHNPIHTDEEIAKKAGLSGIIVTDYVLWL